METAESITKWADETFGFAPYMIQLERAKQEIVELETAIMINAGHKKIAMEAADVIICLSRLAALYPNAVDEKMAINRARKWKVDGQGCGQHVD